MKGAREDAGVRLMLAFQRGDETAFDRIVERYQGAVFSMLRRLLGSHAALEDVAQEAFLRLYRARKRYRPEGRLTTFLFRITYNLALNRLRDDRRQRTSRLPRSPEGEEWEPPAAEGPDPDRALDRPVWAARIEAALAILPGNQRAALVLQHYEGLELAAIGAVLGISEKATKSLLHRARENLRPLLAPYRGPYSEA